MATDVRDLGDRSTGPRTVATPLPLQGPLPSGQLLRPGGSAGPLPRPVSAEAWTQLSADAHRVLVAVAGDWPSPRWRIPSFALQVEAVRRHLAPIGDPALLAASFQSGLALPPWPLWVAGP